MKITDYKKNGEYSIIVIQEEGSDHAHFSGMMFGLKTISGERIPVMDEEGGFGGHIFDEQGTYEECCKAFIKLEMQLKALGHEVNSYTEDAVVTYPRKRMFVNWPLEAVAYAEANHLIFKTEENEDLLVDASQPIYFDDEKGHWVTKE